jgi:hypothetical protein
MRVKVDGMSGMGRRLNERTALKGVKGGIGAMKCED